MDTEDIKTQIAEIDPEILFADGFDEALIGYVQVFNRMAALYDREKCIKILMEDHKMNREEAEEYFEFNVQGAYVGAFTPAFATFLRKV